jgi:hypothetical protein
MTHSAPRLEVASPFSATELLARIRDLGARNNPNFILFEPFNRSVLRPEAFRIPFWISRGRRRVRLVLEGRVVAEGEGSRLLAGFGKPRPWFAIALGAALSVAFFLTTRPIHPSGVGATARFLLFPLALFWLLLTAAVVVTTMQRSKLQRAQLSLVEMVALGIPDPATAVKTRAAPTVSGIVRGAAPMLAVCVVIFVAVGRRDPIFLVVLGMSASIVLVDVGVKLARLSRSDH